MPLFIQACIGWEVGFRDRILKGGELPHLAITKHSFTLNTITASMAEDQQIIGIDLGATTW